MEPFLVEVLPALGEQGAVLSRAGTLPEPGFAYGAEQLATPDGIAYDITLTNTGEGVLLSGTACADVHGRCARCLAPVVEHVQADVEGYYLFEEAEELEGYANDEFDAVDADGRVDVSGPLEGALVYGTPFVMLCSPECKGLCPSCGANLNDGPCGCEAAGAADDDNPFAVLKNLTFDDE